MSQKTAAPTTAPTPRKPRTPFVWNDESSAPAPEEAARTMTSFVAGAFDPEDPNHAQRILDAWEALSRVVAEEYDVVGQTTSLLRRQLLSLRGDEINPPAKELDDPVVDAAVRIVDFVLPIIAVASAGNALIAGARAETIAKMAAVLDPLGSASPITRQRVKIKRIVEWSADDEVVPRDEWIDDAEAELGGREMSLSDQQWRASRAGYLRTKLAEIDPRLALDERSAASLVRLFGRKNGAQKLAANWAWRAGIEGEPQTGESLTDDAPARVVDCYRDPAQRNAAARKKRTARKKRAAPKERQA